MTVVRKSEGRSKRVDSATVAADDVAISETATRLFDCALTLFSEKGFDATSVREIIQAAGVTQPTLYYYCEGKQDLFLKLVRKIYEDSLLSMRQVIGEATTCRDRLRAIASSSFAGCAADARIPRLMFQTTFGPPIDGISETMTQLASQRFAIVKEVIREGIKRGELASGDAASLALVYCCLIDQHVNVLVRQPNPQHLLTPKLARWLVSVFLNGVATPND